MNRSFRQYLVAIPPWIILGALALLLPIFLFWTLHNISKQKQDMIRLLTEKGAALIRSFEAGTRTGMMGMMGRGAGVFRLQQLLSETAQQADILYLVVTDEEGRILAHNDPFKIGERYGTELDLQRVSRLQTEEWRRVSMAEGIEVFEIYRRFAPTQPPHADRGMRRRGPRQRETPPPEPSAGKEIIFVGLDMGPLDEARKEDMRHSLLMGAILLLIGFAGVLSLFLAQAYRTTSSSLNRIKAFSDLVVENMPVGLVALDENGNILSVNRSAEEILGGSLSLGRLSTQSLPKEMLDLSSQLKPGKEDVVEEEVECRLADGRVVSLDVSLSLLMNDQGKAEGHLILFRDMTEVQALKREVETSRRLASLGRLAAGIAHEIRNPLSSIKGFATHFRERYGNAEEDRNAADIMIKEVDRLNRTISQLLEFARPVVLQRKRTPIKALIQHSLKMIEREASSKGIFTRADLPASQVEVEVDPDKIHQALLNLYLNALEAMEQEGTLSVSCSEESSPARVKISVNDTGTGIKGKDLGQIFDPYFTTKQTGSGLGLAIVHKIVEAHGGEILVHSEVGQGTTVTVLLPL